MRTTYRHGRVWVTGLVLAASAVGCQTVHPSTPVAVQVRDAETQAPVPGATVRVVRYGSHSEDHEQGFTTGPDGIARSHVPPPDEGGVFVEVAAPGYLLTSTTLSREITDALASAKPFHPYKGPPLSVTVDSFAGPRPTAELILPPGFRGLVKAEIHVQVDGSWPAHQRLFTYTVPTNGVVRLNGPAVFGESVGPDIVAKSADGAPLPKEGKNTDVLFRWVRHNGHEVYFVVGTSVDAETARRSLGVGDDDRPSPKSSGGGGRGGGGGGGRHGGRGGGGGMGGP